MDSTRQLEEKISSLENKLSEMDLYRTFVEEAWGGLGFFKHDKLGRIEYINTQLESILGQAKDKIIGRYWNDVLNVSKKEKILIINASKRLFEGKERPRYTIDYISPFKDTRILEIQQSPLVNKKGEVISVYGSIKNVTAEYSSREKIKSMAKDLDNTWKTYDEISTVGVSVVKDRKLVSSNLEMERMTGYSQGELSDMDLKKLYINEEEYLRAGVELYDNGDGHSPSQTERKWRRKDGKNIDCLIRMKPLVTSEDSREYLALAQDVTEQKRAASINSVLYDIIKALNSTEDLDGLINSIYDSLARLIDTTSIYIAVYEADDDRIRFPYYRDIDVIKVVENASKSGSLTAEVIKTGKPLLLTEDDIKERFSQKHSDKYPIGKISKVWLGVPLKINHEVIGVLAVQSYSDPGCYTSDDIPLLESVSGYIATAINRRRKENDLRLSEQKYRELFERTSDFVFVHDLEGNFIESNSGFKKEVYPEASDEDLTIDNIHDILLPERKGEFADYIRRMLDHGHDKGLMAVRPQGTTNEIIVEYNNTLIRDSKGLAVYVQGSARDVTVRFTRKREKKALEKQLMQSQKLEAIGTLTSGIAHDFNNILFIILSYAQLGEELEVDEKTRSFFKSIHNGAMRARDLVKQLLSFSRPPDESYQPIDISPSVIEVLKLMRASLPTTIEIRKNIKPDIGYINGDPTQIHQVIMNLITNAFQAIEPQKGVIDVILSDVDLEFQTPDTGFLAPGKYIELIVKDCGVGMDKDTQERIFDPFFTTKDVGVGTGLGLSMVHGIVKKHKGHIYVNSEEGRGTVFKIYFPEILKSKNEQIDQVVDIPGGSERVLVIDDEPMIVDLYVEILKRVGYQPDVFTKSSTALEEFEKNPYGYDLVLSDHTMPEITGLELSARIRSIREDIPIILSTGFYGAISKKERDAAGINDILLKPINKNNLLQIIRSTLDNLT